MPVRSQEECPACHGDQPGIGKKRKVFFLSVYHAGIEKEKNTSVSLSHGRMDRTGDRAFSQCPAMPSIGMLAGKGRRQLTTYRIHHRGTGMAEKNTIYLGR